METATEGDRKINDILSQIKNTSRRTVADLKESKREHAQKLHDVIIKERHNTNRAYSKL